MGLWDTFKYDVQRGWYDLTGIGTPPIVLPADSIQTPAAEKVRNEAANMPTAADMFMSSIKDTAGELGGWIAKAVTILVIVAVAGVFLYFFLRKKAEALA